MRSRTASTWPSRWTPTVSTILSSFRSCSRHSRPVEADLVIGSRFAGERAFRSSFTRRLGIRLFSLTVSAIARRRLTDATSGFRAVNRRGIALFAADYPHDYPEVEATVMVVKHRLRVREVPVRMRERTAGRSSITALRAVYYIFKVLLALFVELFRPRKETREVA